MKRSHFFRTPRRAALALTALALALPSALSAVTGSMGLVSPAAAQETQKADTARIVVIGGALTEIVYALGEERRLIARDSTSTYPEAAMSLPDVGYMRALSPEGVLGVDPSACLVFEDAVVGVHAARAAGMRVIGVTTAHTRDELVAAGAERAVVDFEDVRWPV